jgi:hypothetical protein
MNAKTFRTELLSRQEMDASLPPAVFCAGSIVRSGTNAEFHIVDERIVGHKPRSLGFAEAAALPLTSITASIRALAAPFPGSARDARGSWRRGSSQGGALSLQRCGHK